MATVSRLVLEKVAEAMTKAKEEQVGRLPRPQCPAMGTTTTTTKTKKVMMGWIRTLDCLMTSRRKFWRSNISLKILTRLRIPWLICFKI
uniref:Uncharacterized protein MANES_13G082000 n=1 Tax=Rhizophora mucronata TaxID=61149 RepID=A0A2P2JMZ2_RHIMU